MREGGREAQAQPNRSTERRLGFSPSEGVCEALGHKTSCEVRAQRIALLAKPVRKLRRKRQRERL